MWSCISPAACWALSFFVFEAVCLLSSFGLLKVRPQHHPSTPLSLCQIFPSPSCHPVSHSFIFIPRVPQPVVAYSALSPLITPLTLSTLTSSLLSVLLNPFILTVYSFFLHYVEVYPTSAFPCFHHLSYLINNIKELERHWASSLPQTFPKISSRFICPSLFPTPFFVLWLPAGVVAPSEYFLLTPLQFICYFSFMKFFSPQFSAFISSPLLTHSLLLSSSSLQQTASNHLLKLYSALIGVFPPYFIYVSLQSCCRFEESSMALCCCRKGGEY